jgi:hypothetical protein
MRWQKIAFLNMENLMLAFISILLGISLSIVCLLNFAYFYEFADAQKIRLFLIVMVCFTLIIFLVLRAYVLLIRHKYLERKKLLFIGFLGLVLLRILFYSSYYYWSIPQIHTINICYDTNNLSEHLKLFELHDAKTGEEYLPSSLGYHYYPIVIAANTCAEGRIISLPLRNKNWEGVVAVFEEKIAPNTVRTKLNNSMEETTTLINHDQIAGTENILISHGVTSGIPITNPWDKGWFVVIKWLSLVLSSALLALILFAISETIIAGSNHKVN